jgi:hypothetical protein
VQVSREEWSKPVESASNQTQRLRVLMDSGLITPDEYARIVDQLVVAVNAAPPPSSQNSAAEQQSRVVAQQPKLDLTEVMGWTKPIAIAGGKAGTEFRARMVGTETSLDPNTFVETMLFVVELCVGNGGDESLVWRVAHPFTEFVSIHQHLKESKSGLTKEALAAFPAFPQADAARASKGLGHRRTSLFAFFGGSKKGKGTAAAAASTSTSSPQTQLAPQQSSSTLVRTGLEFLRGWLRDVFGVIAAHPGKPGKHGGDPVTAFKPFDVFFHVHENVG